METQETVKDYKSTDNISPKTQPDSSKFKVQKKLLSKGGQLPKIIFVAFIASIVLVAAIVLLQPNEQPSLNTISKSSLEKVLPIDELSTVDYTYNAVATKYKNNDPKKDVMYYVAYEGTVTAGIEFSKIDISVDENKKVILITLPEIKIQSITVNMGTMEYIFTKDKHETEDISQEAYKLCVDDLESRIDNESTLFDIARETAISTVSAFFEPWIDSLEKSYTVEIQ